MSKFALIQHILSTQVSVTGPMVLWFYWPLHCFKIHSLVLTSVSHLEAVMTSKTLAGLSVNPPVI